MQLHLPPGDPPLALHLWNTVQVMGEVFDNVLAGAGGSRYHFFIFEALQDNPVASQRTLAKAVGVDGATITHHLNAMESAGLIARTRSPEDRRVHRVSLTDAGAELQEAMADAVERYNEQMFAGLTDPERDQLGHLTARLQANADTMATSRDQATHERDS